MLVNVLLLATFSFGVYVAVVSNGTPTYVGLGTANKQGSLINKIDTLTKPRAIPTKQQFLTPNGVYFGASTKNSPYNAAELAGVTSAAGVAPSMTEYFVNWTEAFDPTAVADAYKGGTLPVISWEPWAGGEQSAGANGTPGKANIDQPKYKLSNIYNGDFDTYITTFAKAVAANKWPIVLRFAHEMNGTWYPWSEQENGNKPGDYVKAYQHVYDLFQKAGATNVIWVWSPNIIRPVPNVSLANLYPGNQYVDWVGLTGYSAVTETTPDTTFDATLKELATFTNKPVLLTETGAQPGPDKAAWISAFFPWLKKNPNIIGFVWTEKDIQTGANADWRFDATPQAQAAFRAGLPSLTLATGVSAGKK